MIPRRPFGKTGHQSSRAIFGAAALAGMRQEKADRILDLLFEHGVNHIDTAADYGLSEERIGPWMARHRDQFFLATKTGARDHAGARDSIHRSLERLRTDRLDLIQLHNLVEPEEWERALSAGGALEAATEAREAGLVRFIGVTGHGTRIAARHLQSLDRFDFDSVLLPYNFAMIRNPSYAADFEALASMCRDRGVAVQTIKSAARRRWREEAEHRFSWYEPIREPDALRRCVAWVLSRGDFFLNTSSDATLLPTILEAAAAELDEPSAATMSNDADRLEIEAIFAPGEMERI